MWTSPTWKSDVVETSRNMAAETVAPLAFPPIPDATAHPDYVRIAEHQLAGALCNYRHVLKGGREFRSWTDFTEGERAFYLNAVHRLYMFLWKGR